MYEDIPLAERQSFWDKCTRLIGITLEEASAVAENTNPAFQKSPTGRALERSMVLRNTISAYKTLGEIVKMSSEFRSNVGRVLSGAVAAGCDLPILKFITLVSPTYEEPEHLFPYLSLFDDAAQKELRVCVSTPPQFGKTESTLHALLRYLMRNPQSRNAYISYSAQRAEHVAVKFAWLAKEAGLTLDGTRKCWTTPQGGYVLFSGVDGPLTGFAIDGIAVLDDLIKGMADANSAIIREHTIDWLQSVAMSRLHKGASVIAIGTRWHPEDPIGHLIDQGWDWVNLPAINEKDESLWPSRWPVELLRRRQKEVGEYVWSALYMGSPRPRGGQVFKSLRTYKELPITPSRVFFGVDMAYTAKTSADYSVCLVMVESEGNLYIHDMIREQVEPPDFKTLVSYKQLAYPNACLAISVTGSEKSSAYFLQELGLELNIQQAVVDKFVRAQPAAAAWNGGHIFVREDMDGLQDLKREVLNFTGLGDKHDDIVDALSAGYNAARFGAVDWDAIEEMQRSLPKARI